MEDRRSKYRIKAADADADIKIDIKFDITELDLLCAYIVSDNRSIKRGNIVNLKRVLDIMNIGVYNNEQESLSKLAFIKKGIEARLEKNLNDSFMIIKDITGGMGNTSNIVFRELNNTEIDWVNQSMSEIIKYSHIEAQADTGLQLLTRLKSTDYTNRGKIVSDIENWLSETQNLFRKAKVDNSGNLSFSLSGDDYIQSIIETYRHITSPSNNLIFGTQALNLLTGGGLQNTRVYVLFGLPGEGKSSTMLDMAIQIKKYNKNYKCKDPTKRPCVVVLVMENDVRETVQRIFSMTTGHDMAEYTEDQALQIMMQDGLHLSENDPIDLIIRYKPNMSVDTSYLYTLVDDLEDEGYEVICLFQDYLKRIKSIEPAYNSDLRLQLGSVVNEFKTFATLKNIPVVTASQLNRTATDSIDKARVKNQSELVRIIGRSNVGDSNLILENADWIALIAPESDKVTGDHYLGIQRVKSRYYIQSETHCAYIPYIGSTIKFQEDIYSPKPCHKTSMMGDLLPCGMSSNVIGGQNEVKSITEIDDVTLENSEYNIFINSTLASRDLSRYYYINPITKTQYKKQPQKISMMNIVR